MELTEYPDLIDRLVRFDSLPCEIPSSSTPLWLTALINAILGKHKKNDPTLFDTAAARAFVNDPKTLRALLTTVPMIGSHNLKFPNANVQLCAISDLNPMPSTSTLIHSASTRQDRRWSGAGNAANAGYIRLLAQEVIIDGQADCLALALADQQGPLWETACQLELNNPALYEACAAQLRQPSDDAVDRLAKQVLWPLGNDEYVAITPVLSFGLTRELHNRLRQRRDQGWRLNTTSTKVGGTQPINVGPYNAELGGRYQHLYAVPPSYGAGSRRLLAVLAKQDSMFRSCQRIRLDFSKLKVPAPAEATASRYRTAHYNAALELVNQVMEPLDKLSLALANETEATTIVAHLPVAEQRWLLAGQLPPPDREQRQWLNARLQDVLRAIPKRTRSSDLILSDADLRMLEQAGAVYFGENHG